MKKKIIALIAAVCMSSSVITVANALPASDPAFSIRCDKTIVESGGELTYTVSLANATGISQIGAKLEFDPTYLTYKSSAVCMDYSYMENIENQFLVTPPTTKKTVQAVVTFKSGSIYNVTEPTDVFKATFKVNKDVDMEMLAADTVKLSSGSITYENSLTPTDSTNLDSDIAPVYVGDTAAVSLTPDKKTVICGEEVTYTLNFPEKFDAKAFETIWAYPSNLEFVKGEGLISGETVNVEKVEEGVKVLWVSQDLTNKSLSGDSAKIVFKALKRGTAEVTKASAGYSTVETGSQVIPFDPVNIPEEVKISGSMNVEAIVDKTSVMSGDTVHVTIRTAENVKNLTGIGFTVKFDNSKFKLAEAPKDNVVDTKTGHGNATCFEEGTINYMWILLGGSINGVTDLMSFDLVATGETDSDGDAISFTDTESYPDDGIVDFDSSENVVVYPMDSADIDAAQKLIDDIPAITADNYAAEEVVKAIADAEAAYNALADAKKTKVNTANLLSAKEAVAGFKAAADKAAADAVQAALDALEVKEDNWKDAPEAIAAVKTAYDALTDEQKALVTGFDEKIAAEQAKYDAFAKAAADKAAADAAAAAVAEGYINSIGEVTEDSGNAILMAENIYNALTDDQKALVSDDAKAKLTAARTAYDVIIADKEAKAKAEADKAAADAVAAKIDALDVESPTFTADAEAAQAAYDALTDDQKALVTNYADIAAKTAEYAAMADILVTVENIGGSYVVNAKERKSVSEHQIVIAAGYNADDTLKEVKFTTSDNGKVVVSGEKVKTFVWNSVAGMVPYASVEK